MRKTDTSATSGTGKAKPGEKLLKSDRLFYVYIRALVSSQATTLADMALGFALFAWCDLSTALATAIGVAFGGILNCILNYSFVFRSRDCDYRAVLVKYAVVWISSVLINTFGTQLLYNTMQTWTWLQDLGFRPDGYFAAARITTAAIVYMFWNFALRRHFVYRRLPIDKYLIAIFTIFSPRKNRNVADRD